MPENREHEAKAFIGANNRNERGEEGGLVLPEGVRPTLFVFAGPNGAGKSTLVRRLGLAGRLPMVNPDEIAVAMAGSASALTAPIQVRAGRLATKRRLELLERKASFGIETTLSGHAELRLMERARELGYRVLLFFVVLANPTLSNARVSERVVVGGHDIPEEDIFRRFGRIGENLAKAGELCHFLCVLDNSGEAYGRLFLRDERGVRWPGPKDEAPFMPAWVRHALALA